MKPPATVDTTLIVDASLKPPKRPAVKACLAKYTTALPQYALKEFSAGALGNYVWAHNKLQESGSFAEMFGVLSRMARSPNRNRASTALEALEQAAAGLTKMFEPLPLDDGQSADSAAAAYHRDAIRTLVDRGWRNRLRWCDAVTHELKCFSEERPALSPEGRLVVSTGCDTSNGCAAAELLRQYPQRLKKVLEAVPNGKDEKRENKNRHKALRALVRDRQWDPSMCRHLGDAVFAILAAPRSTVLTTNTSDHEPLCAAVGVAVDKP